MINSKMVYTDLAIEAKEMVHEEKDVEIEGIEVNIEKSEGDDVTVTSVDVFNEKGSEAIGKPIGKYITIESDVIKESNIGKHREISQTLSDELKKLLPEKENPKILVVGLGNWNVTADSLGPKVVENMIITRHLFVYSPESVSHDTFGDVSGIIPGVMATTGMETSEIIRGIVDKTTPEVIFVIDALAARNVKRVNSTIQLTNTGIYPGSGVGNKRKEITQNSMGIPVIAIGVPTVIYATTLINDVLENIKDQNFEIDENFYTDYLNLCVTPKEEDIIVNRMQTIISDGINLFAHKGIKIEEVREYIY